MKGIMSEIEEMKANAKPISYSPTKEGIDSFVKEMMDWLQEAVDSQHQHNLRLIQIQKENTKYLQQKSKELGKEIPVELYHRLVYMVDIPVGSSFIEKYQEWFDEPKKPEETTTTEMVLQHAINNFPVRK